MMKGTFMGYRTFTCPIARDCGGCEWLAVPYTIQLRRKQAQVEELLGPMISGDAGELRGIVGMKGEKLVDYPVDEALEMTKSLDPVLVDVCNTISI